MNLTKPEISQVDLISTIAETEVSPAENDHEKELDHLTSTVAGKICEGVQKTDSFFSSACIYRVPEHLRKLNESAYTPKLIAIGPLHREDEHLQTPLQHVKMSYTNHLLSRVTAGMDLELAKQKNFKLLKECLAEMKPLIDRAKKRYAAEVTVDEEMMLVDGCFILEYLYRCSQGSLENGQNTTDPIRGKRAEDDVDSDLLLLENQIPFFVLEKLFQLTVARIPKGRKDKNYSLTDYVRGNFRYMSPTKGSSNNSGSAKTRCSPRDCILRIFGNKQLENPTTKKEEQQEDRNAECCYHILHKIHDAYMLPTDQTKMEEEMEEEEEEKQEEEEEVLPSATELVYAGVKFVPGAAKNLLQVKFTEPEGLFGWCHSAHFEIPQLEIYDQTEPLLRNFVALEQCCPEVSQHVSSYVDLMDMLVKSDKDVRVLEKAGVLRNYVGVSQDATNLFNNLTKEITVRDQFYELTETCKKATQYSKRFWPRNMAHLRRTYFSSPWTFMAFCAGFIIFVVTFVQFVRDFLRKKG